MTEHQSGEMPPTPTRSATLELPLRGLAGEGAAAIVAPALRELPGVLDVEVRAADFRVRVVYDAATVTPDAIRERLHAIASPDTAHGDGRWAEGPG